MKIVAILPVRNEGWILGASLRALLMWVDEVVICLHKCTDGSYEVIREIEQQTNTEQINLCFDDFDTWEEMRMRHSLLETARGLGATHIVILDADEIISGNLLPTIRKSISAIPDGHSLQLPGYNLRGGIARYHANGIWGNRWFSTAFRDDPRLGWVGDRFHQREPQGVPLLKYSPIAQGGGGVVHLWGASERRLHERHRFYRLQESLRWPKKDHAEIERMYSLAEKGDASQPAYGTPATWRYSPVPASWWEPYAHLIPYLHLDAEPWQRAWADEQIRIHGRERFEGLSV